MYDYPVSALNAWLYTDRNLGTTSTGMERDVYGMSLVIYEVGFHHPGSTATSPSYRSCRGSLRTPGTTMALRWWRYMLGKHLKDPLTGPLIQSGSSLGGAGARKLRNVHQLSIFTTPSQNFVQRTNYQRKWNCGFRASAFRSPKRGNGGFMSS